MIDYTDAGRFGFAAQQKLTYEGPPVPVSKDQATRLGAVRSPLQSWDEMAAYSTCVFPFLRDVSFPSALPVRFRASRQFGRKRFSGLPLGQKKPDVQDASHLVTARFLLRAVANLATPLVVPSPASVLPLWCRGFFLEQTDDFYRQIELALKRR